MEIREEWKILKNKVFTNEKTTFSNRVKREAEGTPFAYFISQNEGREISAESAKEAEFQIFASKLSKAAKKDKSLISLIIEFSDFCKENKITY